MTNAEKEQTTASGHLLSLPTTPARRRRSRNSVVVALAISVLALLALMFVPMSRVSIGLFVLVSLLAMLFAGIPIAFGMLGAAMVGLWRLGGWNAVEETLSGALYNATASWSLSVVPAFILMGIVLWRSGASAKAYNAAKQWLSRMPGGLAVGTNFAGAGMAAASGSTLGITYALTRAAFPEMMKAGYAPSLAAGTVAMAGTLGQLIPPSIMLVIYAGAAGVPVGPQLIAAIVPGVLIAVGYAVMITVRTAVNPSLAPRTEITEITWSSRARSLVGVLPIAVIFFIVIGGLLGGVVTATEAGGLGAIVAICLAPVTLGKGNRKVKEVARVLKDSLRDTIAATAAIFLVLMAVEILTHVMTLSRIASNLAGWVTEFGLQRATFLLLLLVVYLILGMCLDPLSMMLLTVPVLAAPLGALGVDMLWFGVFVVVLAEIAVVSPPIGVHTFIVHRIVQDRDVNMGVRVSLNDVFSGVTWFILVAVLVLVLLIYVPEVAMWLPE